MKLFRFFKRESTTSSTRISRKLFVPDVVVCSGYNSVDSPQSSRVQFGGVSVRGKAHRLENTPRQDAISLFTHSGWIFFAASDGVSSSEQSHFGSNFLINQLVNVIEKSFPTEISFTTKSWKTITQALSKSLVAYFESSTFSTGGEKSKSTSERRILAASSVAATLELIAISEKPDGLGNYDFAFIRLAGDGLIAVSDQTGSFERLHAVDTKPNQENLVSALPVTDREPEIVKGVLKSGCALILVTDGIGNNLFEDLTWLRMLERFSLQDEVTQEDLLEIAQHGYSEYLDDRSLLVVKNCL